MLNRASVRVQERTPPFSQNGNRPRLLHTRASYARLERSRRLMLDRSQISESFSRFIDRIRFERQVKAIMKIMTPSLTRLAARQSVRAMAAALIMQTVATISVCVRDGHVTREAAIELVRNLLSLEFGQEATPAHALHAAFARQAQQPSEPSG